jgi:hypothetical protein
MKQAMVRHGVDSAVGLQWLHHELGCSDLTPFFMSPPANLNCRSDSIVVLLDTDSGGLPPYHFLVQVSKPELSEQSDSIVVFLDT